MKTKLTETKFKSAISLAKQLFSSVACVGAVILICTSASAQNLFVSGSDARSGEIFKFTWDGAQSIFASGLSNPSDVAVDSAGNLFVLDFAPLEYVGNWVLYKYTPNGFRTIFASGLSDSYLSVDGAGNVFVADYNNGKIYKYTPNGARTTFASGLYYPVGMAFDGAGNLFVADNTNGNIHQGRIYKYAPGGSRVIFAVLDPSDLPQDLAFDSMGNLFMADWGGNIYKFTQQRVRTTLGSVPNRAQSLAFDSAGNLFVVDPGDATFHGNAIYKFTSQGGRSTFASRHTETFAYLAFSP